MGIIQDLTKKYFLNQNKTKENTFLNKKVGLLAPKSLKFITETGKGLISQPINSLSQIMKIGEPHPHDMEQMLKLYKEVPLIHGSINKIVDHTVGPGFVIKSDNEMANEIIKTFITELNFDILVRKIVQDVLVYGNAYLELVLKNGMIIELIPRNPQSMYVKRDNKGTLQGYTQLVNQNTKISFTPEEIIHFKNNVLSDEAYGTSILNTLLQTISRKLSIEQDLMTIISRKANAPYNVTVGDENNFPSNDDLNTVRQDFEDLQNDQEWVHGPHVKIDTLGFKDKLLDLNEYLKYFQDQIIFGLEVPIVMLGQGSIPEGLAQTQKEVFERKIVSLQLNIETTLEKELFPRILKSHNIIIKHVEFEWQPPTPEQKQKELTNLLQLMTLQGSSGILSPELVNEIEKKIASLIGIEDFSPEEKPENERPPSLPGQNQDQTQLAYHPNNIFTEQLEQGLLDKPLKEFIGFNYAIYLQDIKEFIESPEFLKREFKGFTYIPKTQQKEWEEITIKYALLENLNKRQVTQLRKTLITGFEEGKSIRNIRNEIMRKVKPKNLSVKIPETRNAAGELLRKSYTMSVNADTRAWSMARTETIRASSQGTLKQYEKLGINKVQWSATNDGRTCAYCESQNNKILTLSEAQEAIPSHDSCRCSFLAVQE